MVNLPTHWEFLLLSRRDSLIQPSGLHSVKLNIGAVLSDGLTGRKCSDDRVDPHKLLSLQEGWYDFLLLLYTFQTVVLWQRCHVLHPPVFCPALAFLSLEPHNHCCWMQQRHSNQCIFYFTAPKVSMKVRLHRSSLRTTACFSLYFFQHEESIPYCGGFFKFHSVWRINAVLFLLFPASYQFKTYFQDYLCTLFPNPVYHKANNRSHVWSTLSFVLVCDLLYGVKIEVRMKSPYDQVGGHGCLSLFN